MSDVRPQIVELTLARMREFYREPGAVFWVFGFPVLLAIGLTGYSLVVEEVGGL